MSDFAEGYRAAIIRMDDRIDDYESQIDKLRAEIGRLQTALQEIERWSHAYPLSAFPEPDLAKAHELLKAGGMTLDVISADAMRHVITEVGEMARRALEEK